MNKKPLGKHNSIKIEDIVLGESYKLSINPASQPVSLGKLEKWHNDYVSIISAICKLNRIVLCLEASPTGRMHYHGVYEINNMREHLNLLYYLGNSSTYDLDIIDDEIFWFNYCIKQDVYFSDYLLVYPFVSYNYVKVEPVTVTSALSNYFEGV